MRLQISKSKNAASLYIVKSTYINGVHSSKVVEKLGTELELKEKLGDIDVYEWGKQRAEELTRLEKEGQEPSVIAEYNPNKRIVKGEQRSFNVGFIFLQKIYNELGIDKICNNISKKHSFKYDLNSILSRLVYSRILFPASKLKTAELSKKFIEAPNFDIHHIYRSLDVIAKEMDYIQSSLYKNSTKVITRNTKILYYDCTNYFFEIEEDDEFRKYGYSKEHRPNPLVQMGLFMDADGIPLAFNISPGNTNEQNTLIPLEQKILQDFEISKFVVCTDAGLSSTTNRKFNDRGNRAFITTQSIKKLKKHLKDWAVSSDGWKLDNQSKEYNLSEIDEEEYFEEIFYKERFMKENGIEQRIVVTFSPKYKNYQRNIRSNQIQRAIDIIEKNPGKMKKANGNDPKRFIDTLNTTKDGTIANKSYFSINEELIEKEALFDGFYAVCTNLSGDVKEITKANKRRWEIEECFRIMKSEFKARPVYVRLEDRIKAHFTTCFISLMIFRILEKKLNNKYTCVEIIDELRNMNMSETAKAGYIPSYTSSDLTDDLHEAFGFTTDCEIVTYNKMKKILKQKI